jgi:hypothetical protein
MTLGNGSLRHGWAERSPKRIEVPLPALGTETEGKLCRRPEFQEHEWSWTKKAEFGLSRHGKRVSVIRGSEQAKPVSFR